MVQMEKETTCFTKWAEFQSEVLKRFSVSPDRTPYEELLSLWQEDLVRNYRLRFEVLSTTVKGVTKETLTTLFMNGLVDDVRAKVRLFNPRCLEEMMKRALQVEEKNWILDTRMGLRLGTLVTHPGP